MNLPRRQTPNTRAGEARLARCQAPAEPAGWSPQRERRRRRAGGQDVPDHFGKIVDTLNAGRHGQQAAAAWIGKELLRDALNLRAKVSGSTPCERNVRDRLFRFYHWCARHDDIPELLALARTIARSEDQITPAVITAVT